MPTESQPNASADPPPTDPGERLWQSLQPGFVLGNYRILEMIGRGGMGAVFKAEHRRMERIVALKVIAPEALKVSDVVQRFLREVKAVARLQHPNIVTAHDADQVGDIHFLVMQYVEGSDLSTLVKQQGPLPVETAVRCIIQAAQGLEYAHEQGVIHRDIKPANLLLDRHGVVKILDLGLARIDNLLADSTPDHSLTGTGTVMGTVDYMSPEQALDTKHADRRSDIYSLGVTLYYLLTGKSLFPGDTMMKKLIAHREAPVPKLEAARPDAPEWLESVFQRMVAKKPEDRFQTMTELLAALPGQPGSQMSGGITIPLSGTSDAGSAVVGAVAGKSSTQVASAGSAVTMPAADSATLLNSQLETFIAASDAAGTARTSLAKPRRLWIAAAVILASLAGIGLALWNRNDTDIDSRLAQVPVGGDAIQEPQQQQPPISLPKTIDLLTLIDPAKDAVTGVWERTGPDLLGKGSGTSVCEAPYRPADEYDIVAEFTVPGDAGDVSLFLSRHGRPFKWSMGVFGRDRFGFSLIDGRSVASDLDAQRPGLKVVAGQRHSTRVEVRRDKLAGYFDGQLVCEVPVEYKSFATDSAKRKDASLLALRINNPATVFHRLEVVEITGAGTLTRSTYTNTLGMEFVLIPKGKSWLGGGAGKPGDKEVEIKEDFYLGKYEVMQEEWEKVMGSNPSGIKAVAGVATEDQKRFPVEWVSWDDCQLFIKRVTERVKDAGWAYRLPKEVEWEYACRGGPMADRSDGAFDYYFEKPTNQLLPEQSNFITGMGLGRTSKVGSYPPNRLGLCDMHGNVWEWCDDVDEASQRVWRGGSWYLDSEYCRAAFRTTMPPSSLNTNLGLRLIRVPLGKEIVAPMPPAEKKAEASPSAFANALGMEFVQVPKGKSWLGGGNGQPGDKEVDIQEDFYLGRYEVTQEEWEKVMGHNPSYFSRAGGGQEAVKDIPEAELKRFPVEQVSWNDAQLFLDRLNQQDQQQGWVYRLPKEVEWEYACRGGPMSDKRDSAFDFYFDKPVVQLQPEQANFDHGDKSLQRTCKVGSYNPNKLGLYDMHGNVYEWCDDEEQVDNGASPRVLRSSSWNRLSQGCRTTVRGVDPPSFQNFGLGLRLARVPVIRR